MSPPSLLVLQGPNLNLLGTRQPDVYGRVSLDEIHDGLAQLAAEVGVAVAFFQSNHEGELVDRIHAASKEEMAGALVNAAAYTHTSVALRDAMAAVNLPFVEVHLSNPYARESFRQHSLLSDLAVAVVCGLGAFGYEVAFRGLVRHLRLAAGGEASAGV